MDATEYEFNPKCLFFFSFLFFSSFKLNLNKTNQQRKFCYIYREMLHSLKKSQKVQILEKDSKFMRDLILPSFLGVLVKVPFTVRQWELSPPQTPHLSSTLLEPISLSQPTFWKEKMLSMGSFNVPTKGENPRQWWSICFTGTPQWGGLHQAFIPALISNASIFRRTTMKSNDLYSRLNSTLGSIPPV